MKATRACSFPGCDRPFSCKGYCASHYEQKRLGRQLTAIKPITRIGTPFWDRVDIPADPDACWEWKAGTRGGDGRGCIRWNGRTQSAYRVAWELTNGPIPAGMWICHACDNPPCVRPDHLFLGTPKDNTQDMWSKGRAYTGRRPSRYGDAHHQTRYPDALIAEIRARHASGETQIQLIRSTGISQSQMSRILNGQSRKETP
jgi:hypothetical protein